MKKISEKRCKKGFTLIEMLVVVLIIGILAGIALPQYQMAVTKAKVASILPLMRRWKDALTEYKLQHGEYCPDGDCPEGDDLGVNWPSDWKEDGGNNGPCGDHRGCKSDYWSYCWANEEMTGEVYCLRSVDKNDYFYISMCQSDEPYNEICRDKIICYARNDKSHKICKALGGKLQGDYYILH